MYQVFYTRIAVKDIPKLKAAKLEDKERSLIEAIPKTPFQAPPPYEKLGGDMQGAYSRRTNVQHRLVYEVQEKQQTVKIISMCGRIINFRNKKTASYLFFDSRQFHISKNEKVFLLNYIESKLKLLAVSKSFIY